MTLNATGAALNGVAMVSTGGSFVVKPGSFTLSNIVQTSTGTANPGATTPTGVKFVKAGETFSATVTATTCVASATNCVVASAPTPNFGKELTPESVSLTATLVTGLNLTNSPPIVCTVCFGAFSGGITSGTDFNWPEVGIITLTPILKSGSYLSVSGFTTTGTVSGNVGRFYPDHYNTMIVASATAPIGCGTGLTCPLAYNGMVYSGQSFSLTINAMNSSDVTTTNFNTTSGFAKTVTLGAYSALGGATSLSGVGTLSAASETAFGAGTLTDTTESFAFATVPTAPTNIYIRATDADGATSLRTTSIEGGVAVVSGRVKVSNAYGSELLPLQLAATAQFYNASGSWVPSTTDTLTNLTLLATYPIGSGTTTATKSPSTGMTAGVLTINLAKPTNGPGSTTITPGAPSYLSPYTIPGTATFGIYKGNSSIIYLRENY